MNKEEHNRNANNSEKTSNIKERRINNNLNNHINHINKNVDTNNSESGNTIIFQTNGTRKYDKNSLKKNHLNIDSQVVWGPNRQRMYCIREIKETIRSKYNNQIDKKKLKSTTSYEINTKVTENKHWGNMNKSKD